MTSSLLVDARKGLAEALSHAEWPTLTYPPDDPGVIPCYVLLKPTLLIQDQFMSIRFPVYVLGRAVADEDAQFELDQAVEEALVLLRGPDVALSDVQPTTLTYGDVTYPAYVITTVLSGQFC